MNLVQQQGKLLNFIDDNPLGAGLQFGVAFSQKCRTSGKFQEGIGF